MKTLGGLVGIGLALTVYWMEGVKAMEVQPKDVYSKVQHLNEGLITLLRHNMRSDFTIQVTPELMQNTIQPRHVYQLALDVELKLAAIVRANGVKVPPIHRILARPYTPKDVSDLLEIMQQRIERLLEYFKIPENLYYKEHGEREPLDVFYALERMDRFLLKMGAPTVQPGHVLRRAHAIAGLAEKLCRLDICADIRRRAMADDDVIIPAHVYQETYRYIEALHLYVKKYNTPLTGDVLALQPQDGMIRPAQVNKLMGVALADTIAVAKESLELDVIELTPFKTDAIPRDVWCEINYARRLLETVVQQ